MLKTVKINNILVVSFDSITRLNAVIAEPVKEELKALFNQSNTKLIINLENIKYIDSTGFSVFLSVKKVAGSNGGQFKLCNLSPDVMRLFEMLQLNYVFQIYPTLDECVKSFQ